MESSSEVPNHNLLSDNKSNLEAKKPLASPVEFALWFTGALLIRLWFNFGTSHPDALDSADAAEYLRYATAISKLNFSAPLFGPEWKEFAISGPAFPFFLLLCSQLSFSTFDAANSVVFLIGQSVVSALTVALIAQISKHLWNRQTGYWAGGIAAIYPGFVVNTGRLYSETFATFLEMAAVGIFIRFILKRNSSPLLLSLLGSLLVLLQLTRSSLILLSGLLLALVCIVAFDGKIANWKKALVSTSSVIIGMLLVLTPWLIFQKNAFNKMTAIVDRVGHYNLFIGTNTDTQGFLTYPYPDGRGIEEKSFLQLTLEAYKKSPTRFIKLALDKPARLYKFPWNDFRTSIGPFDFHSQVLVHQLVLLFAIFGLCLGVSLLNKSDFDEQTKRNILLARYSLLLVVALNLPYLAFITVPRYNLLAMPVIIVLAAAGITTILQLLKSSTISKAPKIATLTALFLLIYLRDDLRSPLTFNSVETASLYIVQGADLLTRNIVGALGAIILFSSIYFCSRLFNEAKRSTILITIVTGLAGLLLCTFPQRANGRIGEGIVTLARVGEELKGKIAISPSNLKADANTRWFVLIDSDDGQILKNQFAISLNGKKLNGPVISSIQALDDWHYIKNNPDTTTYLDCAYIFDCLTKPSAISNSELRQWFIVPVELEQLAPSASTGFVEIDLQQKSLESSKFFSAAPGQNNSNKAATALIPAQKMYSWEKAFYGVENDSGFTDTRLDEVVPVRQSKWSLSYKGKSEDLNVDINVRLLKVSGTAVTDNTTISASGAGAATLLIPAALVNSQRQLFTVTTTYAPGATKKELLESLTQPENPKITLEFIDIQGKQRKLPLFGMPSQSKERAPQSMSFIVDLAEIKGSDYRLHCEIPDSSWQVALQAKPLNCHPLFSPQELF